ncbi:MAG TPA: isocitrate/isopropylmalate family dehydrogenase [Myxococcota bacterium]|nr:isocitrate/isopropylmalate family dehydrogenase [Myxococcota bacterium]
MPAADVRWTSSLPDAPPPRAPILGVLPGEGIGPEVVAASLQILDALPGRERFEVRWGGLIGGEAERAYGVGLTQEVTDLCAWVFDRGGAVLAGPGGGRFVYDLRRRFDLFCKLAPIQPAPELAALARVRGAEGVDLLVVRENVAGAYLGRAEVRRGPEGVEVEHSFRYTERDVRRVVQVAASLARRRRGRLLVALKDGGLPALSDLWRDVATSCASDLDLRCDNVDLVAYEIVQRPEALDVIVAPNLLGDVLVDVAGALMGSRGVTFSGNFAPDGAAVYQTSHGAAFDIAGKDIANPVGQILSLAMMLRESFGMAGAAAQVEDAVRRVWRAGVRTRDVAEAGHRVVGTAEMGGRIADEVARDAAGGRDVR